MELPITYLGHFKYPLERTPINEGYKMFNNWAMNSGTQSLDWYSTTTSAYRDATKLYNAN